MKEDLGWRDLGYKCHKLAERVRSLKETGDDASELQELVNLVQTPNSSPLSDAVDP